MYKRCFCDVSGFCPYMFCSPSFAFCIVSLLILVLPFRAPGSVKSTVFLVLVSTWCMIRKEELFCRREKVIVYP